jgi:large subunit ribosomal protein L18
MKNKARIRKKLSGTAERPRLSVYRSGRHMYAQLVDDVKQTTLVSASTVKATAQSNSSCEAAKAVGEALAKKALEKNINNVVFDRSGYVYHGRVRAVADGARQAGLNF